MDADGPRLGEDLEGADEEGAVGGGRGGGGDRRRAAAAQVAGDGEDPPEAEHAGWSGGRGRAGRDWETDDWVMTRCREMGRQRERWLDNGYGSHGAYRIV